MDPARLKEHVKPEVQQASIPFSLPGGGGGSADHVDDSCASNRVENVATEMSCASNRVFVGGMPFQLKSLIQQFIPSRRTYVIDAAFVKGCPTLHDNTDRLSELAKLANALLRREWDVAMKDCRWNTIHVIPVNGTTSVFHPYVIGPAANVIVSDGTSGSVSVKGAKQPMIFESVEKEQITCASGKGKMWLTRFGDDKASRQLDEFDLHELCKFGLWTDTACVTEVLDGASNRVHPRNFVHCCCEKGALLSRPSHKEPRLTTVEITQDNDLRSAETIAKVVSQLSGPRNLWFCCSPCCGGSPWQRLNMHLAAKKGWQSTMIRLIAHWDLHLRLWSGFMVAVEHGKRVDVDVILECLKNCEYWEELAVSEFLERLEFSCTEFDGRMYGLVSRFTGIVTLPIRRPWRRIHKL